MTMSPRRVPAAQIRAGDADRDATLAQLSEHFGAGRLTAGELDQRSGRVLTARTMGELAEVMSDLPRIPGPMPEHRPMPPPRGTGLLSGLAPLGVAIAFVTSAVTIGPPQHDWFPWWTVPLAFLIVRGAIRRLRRLGRPREARGGWPAYS
jgi:hypothetical protein